MLPHYACFVAVHPQRHDRGMVVGTQINLGMTPPNKRYLARPDPKDVDLTPRMKVEFALTAANQPSACVSTHNFT